MTTLFKKLSITTLTLAIASGIVFSVGSSEPSTFEGEATTGGFYSITMDVSTIFTLSSGEYKYTTTKIANLNVTFRNETYEVITNSSGFLMQENNNLDILRLGTDAGQQLKHIRKITANFSNTSSASVSYVYLKFDESGTQTGLHVISNQPLTSNSAVFPATHSDFGYPYRFTVELNGSGAALTSITIEYDC